MKKRSVFEFDSYKKAMSYFLLKEGRRGQLSRAAETLQCQPSFLSRVIKSEVHLTLDHAYLLTQFWGMNPSERDYFQTLVEHERAAAAHYKSFLATRLSELKRSHESLQNRVQKDNFSLPEREAIYFSSWHWSALHFLVSIPEFQSVSALSSRLGLTEMLTKTYLEQLQIFGLVREDRGRWQYAGGQFHIPKNSPFVVLHHQNWRHRAVLDAQVFNGDSVHYTTVLTLSRPDVERLKNLVLSFISETENIARPSAPEESVVLNCDLFRT